MNKQKTDAAKVTQ